MGSDRHELEKTQKEQTALEKKQSEQNCAVAGIIIPILLIFGAGISIFYGAVVKFQNPALKVVIPFSVAAAISIPFLICNCIDANKLKKEVAEEEENERQVNARLRKEKDDREYEARRHRYGGTGRSWPAPRH